MPSFAQVIYSSFFMQKLCIAARTQTLSMCLMREAQKIQQRSRESSP